MHHSAQKLSTPHRLMHVWFMSAPALVKNAECFTDHVLQAVLFLSHKKGTVSVLGSQLVAKTLERLMDKL